MSLGVFDDCLCICDSPSRGHFDIWVMKEYGVQESWSKQFVIETPVHHQLWQFEYYLPIKLLNDGEILMLRKGFTLVSYCFGETNVKNVKICRFHHTLKQFFIFRVLFHSKISQWEKI
ncbi:hypothetical protein L1049_025094 [Liquidambar formosana]|uniref:F-box associated domain-containing protein n=1 Tax=Liquidambar formosana TaxID=63359 RepID=A0AAP0X5A9_LIQFO